MIERHDHDGIATLQMQHGKANALDLELCDALADGFDRTARDENVRAVVLTGSGSIFCAGVDLFRIVNEGAPYVARFYPSLSRALRALIALPKPVVAAVNGHAIAGGCLLALACDQRLMASGKGRIGVPELLVGVPFPSIALELLRHSVPTQFLQPMIYTGQTFTVDDAMTRGLIDEVADAEALAGRADEMARALAALRPDAFRITKQQLRAPLLAGADDAASIDAAAVESWSTAETHAHIRGYLDRVVGKK